MITNDKTIFERDLNHIWHPCAQMKDFENMPLLNIVSAKGSYLQLKNGKKVIDAIASWWCKSLGHGHPRLKETIAKQINKFEHVITAGTTNEVIVKLSEKLSQLCQGLNKVFYAGDGSSSVEIALKMSLQSRMITGDTKRHKFIALENGYHGDTIGAMSVSDIGRFRKPYSKLLFESILVKNVPYVFGRKDDLWFDASIHWNYVLEQLEKYADTTTALILEPIVQGAGGIKIYSADFLKKLREWTKKNNIHLIADEIMTGIGRTGKMLACEHAQIIPDFVCLSKGLTSGWMAFSAVLISEKIYNIFYNDYNTGKNFLHSHTYSGNPLGACLALETINIIEEENICEKVLDLENVLLESMHEVLDTTKVLKNIRCIGGIVAADLDNSKERIGIELSKKGMNNGIYLRPIGNTVYWIPPLNVSIETIKEIKNKTIESILML